MPLQRTYGLYLSSDTTSGNKGQGSVSTAKCDAHKCLLRSCKHSSGQALPCPRWNPLAKWLHMWTELDRDRSVQRAQEHAECEKRCLKASISMQHWSKLKQICHSKQNILNIPCPYLYQKKKLLLFHPASVILFLLVCVSLSTLGGTRLTQSLFFFPPSSLPGIPESILTIQNVKNEEKAEEGTAAGRVLSRCTPSDIPVSVVSGCTERMGSLLPVIIKTLYWNKPQNSFSTG